MKENPEKYAQVYAQTAETNVEKKQKKRKRNERIASTIRDNIRVLKYFYVVDKKLMLPTMCAKYVNKKK